MIAALPMYDRSELQPANDRLWAAIRGHLDQGPDRLTRDVDPWDIWKSPDLLLSQSCSLPYRTRLKDCVDIVGTPDYGLPDCPPGYFFSVIVVRKDDAALFAAYRDRTLAYNDPLSQSGWAAPQHHAEAHGFRFTQTLRTGAHMASASAVAGGCADIAAIDALTWQMICAHDNLAAELMIIDRTPATPALPYITAQTPLVTSLFDAIAAGIDSLAEADRESLGLRGIVRIPAPAYLAMPTPTSA